MATQYFGIDIGDGETAVAAVRKGTSIEPHILQLRAKENLITALGVGTHGARFIGEEAFQVSDVRQLHLRFKREFLTNPASHQWMEDFARTLFATLEQEGHIDSLEEAAFYIGCPSGWDDATRGAYLQLMRRAGFTNAAVVSESRAALVYAREAGELRLDGEQLYAPTLIIDAGSSTTDYTFVSNLEEVQLTDTGEVALGAGLIDQLLLDANVALHPERERLLSLFYAFPALRTRCELEARRLKERYFDALRRGTARSYPCETSIRLYTQPEMRVDMICTDAMMDALLAKPLPELDGRGYLAAYRRSLHLLRDALPEKPQLILMTGGAMRMPFMRDIAAGVFEDTPMAQGNNPEFAIARGLCYALRLEERRQGFLADIDALIASDAVENLVADALIPLFDELAPLLVGIIVDELVPELFDTWRRGGIRTLNALIARIQEEAPQVVRGEETQERLRPVIASWLNTLRPRLEELTNPICDRYALPRTSLRLPNFVDIGADVPIAPEGIISFDAIKIIIDVIVAVAIATLAGGTGTALVAGGPLGWVLGLLIGSITAWIGIEFAEKMVMDANIPMPMRGILAGRAVTGRMAGKKDEMILELRGRMHADVEAMAPNVREMVRTVSDTIERQLHAEMERAILLLR